MYDKLKPINQKKIIFAINVIKEKLEIIALK
jgi:hypothetical protein